MHNHFSDSFWQNAFFHYLNVYKNTIEKRESARRVYSLYLYIPNGSKYSTLIMKSFLKRN